MSKIYIAIFIIRENDYKRRGGDDVSVRVFGDYSKAEKYLFERLITFFDNSFCITYKKAKEIESKLQKECFEYEREENLDDDFEIQNFIVKNLNFKDLDFILEHTEINHAEYSGVQVNYEIQESEIQ